VSVGSSILARYLTINRTESGFAALAVQSESEPSPMESIRQSVHDQVINLRTEISQHIQTISDNHTSLQTERSTRLAKQIEESQASVEKEQELRRESELKVAQLQDQLSKTKSELSRTEGTAQQRQRHILDHERDFCRYRADALAELNRLNKSAQQTTAETQTRDRECEALRQTSVDLTTKLESTRKERSKLFDDNFQFKLSNESLREEIKKKTKEADRRQELLRLANQSKGQLETKQGLLSAEVEKLREDVKSKTEKADRIQDWLRLADQSKKQLETEKERLSAAVEKLREEIKNKTEEADRTQELLRLANQSKGQLEEEKEQLSAAMEKLRDKSSQSRSLEMQLKEDNRNLKQRTNELRTMHADETEKFRQERETKNALVEDLNTKLTVSGNTLRECERKLRQAEATHKLQMDHHKQDAKAKFDKLVAESDREREKLRTEFGQESAKIRAESEQERDRIRAESERKCDKTKAECQKAMEAYQKNCDSRVEQSNRENEQRQPSTRPSRSEILVPNTQQSDEVDRVISSPQDLRTAKTRKRVDRQISSAHLKSATDRPGLGHGTRESVPQDGFFEAEYESTFGAQVPLRGRDTQISLVGDEDEIVPETQDFECTQGTAGDIPETQDLDLAPGIADVVPDTQPFQCAQGNVAQFEVMESQALAGDIDQDESVADLSSLPSEELAEMDMLFDRQPYGQERTRSRNSLSHTQPDRTPRRAHPGSTPEDRAPLSQARPKSRANTASRIMPLRGSEVSARRSHTDVGPSRLARTYSGRVSGGDDEPTISVPTNDVTPKHSYEQHSSTRASTTIASQKRKSTTSVEESTPFNKLRKSTQSYAQRPPSKSKSFAPYTPTPTQPAARNDTTFSPSSAAARSTSNQYPSLASSQRGSGRLSSTRNTRSKSKFVNHACLCVSLTPV
jgi:hypothetical protein